MTPNRMAIRNEIERLLGLYDRNMYEAADVITDYVMKTLDKAVRNPADTAITLDIQDGTLGSSDSWENPNDNEGDK
jgi:hypothetical protein